MINDLNRVVLMGHLGNDSKQNSENAPVTLSIATTSRWTDDANNKQKRTDWHNITVFGNLRKYAKQLKKGDRIYVEGELRNNNYERTIGGETVKFYATEIVAQQIDRVTAKTDAAEDSTDFNPEPETVPEPQPTGKRKK